MRRLVKRGAREIAAAVEAAARGASGPVHAGLAVTRSARLIFAAFPAGLDAPKVVPMRRPVVAGNWKMHGSRSANAALLVGAGAAR